MIASRRMRKGLALRFAMPLTVALLLLGGNTFADTYTIDAYNVDSTRGESIWMNENGNNVKQYFAGVVLISLTDTNTGQTWNRDTLCVDLFTDIYIGQTYGTKLLDPYEVSGRNLTRVSWLVDNALFPTPPSQNNSYLSVLPSSDWVTSVAQGAGIQLAIWDIVENNGDGLSAGTVQASTDPNESDPARRALLGQLLRDAEPEPILRSRFRLRQREPVRWHARPDAGRTGVYRRRTHARAGAFHLPVHAGFTGGRDRPVV